MDEKVNFVEFSTKQEIWSASAEKEGYCEFDLQTKVKKAIKDSKEEFIIVGEVSIIKNIWENKLIYLLSTKLSLIILKN